jgi:HEAT repeat protein
LVSVRAQAYRSLGQLVLRNDISSISTSVLKDALNNESNANVRIKIAWLIANYCEKTDRSHDEVMRDLLIKMTSDKKLTSSAVRALGTMTPNVIPLLVPFIRDDDVKVRWNACFAVGRLGVGSAVESLCIAIGSDENFKVRIQAAAAIALTTGKIKLSII